MLTTLLTGLALLTAAFDDKDPTKQDPAKEATSPDKRLIARASEKAITIYEAATQKEVRKMLGHTDDVTAVAFSPDGKLLFSGGQDACVLAWDFASGKLIWKMQIKNPIASVKVSPDGRIVTVVDSTQVSRDIDMPTGKIIRESKP
jgi:WD40 repeat protein